ncbi:glycosyltransferase family 2 protein [Salipiger sp. P9]|nr:glycosyltransferase family 2 protein [Salipiger pentaromativorans]MCR8546320.1 glycosyltransferase family 2 protein [Salipiger pentaromativorans]
MQSVAAAVTMVRDDAFFLKAWVRYYGDLLGRENCYVVNHGRGAEVAELAEGCNIVGIPGDPHPNFDMKRWRLLNGLVAGLRSYYSHVIVGDVDELVVLDPAEGRSLRDWLADQPIRRVLTPLGLEVIHRIDLEPEPVAAQILGPRRHVRLAPHYSKPCVLSLGTKIARGGHFTQASKLFTPEPLYLFHLKFCDFENYVAVMDRRNAVTEAVGAGVKEAAIGRHWFAEARGEDRAVFEGFAALRQEDGFALDWVRKRMQRSWKPRGETGFWQFDRPEYDLQYALPERFFGLF